MRLKQWEQVKFITAGGTVYELHAPPSRIINDISGWGKPEDNMSVTSGPYQHGNSPISYRLQPRTVRMTLMHQFCSRDAYWEGRSTLLSTLGTNASAPNTPVPGTLKRVYLVNGVKTVRCLDCFLVSGLLYEPLQGSRQWHVQEDLQFVANNPIIYDPTDITVDLGVLSADLTLPITFPFLLGTYSTLSGVSVTYTGTWESFPTLTISGPASDVYFENRTTGAKLRFNYAVSVGETVTINLAYDKKTITNNFDINLAQYIRNSDLAQFSIMHSPIVAGGVNLFYMAVDGYAAGTSSFIMTYKNRYYGI